MTHLIFIYDLSDFTAREAIEALEKFSDEKKICPQGARKKFEKVYSCTRLVVTHLLYHFKKTLYHCKQRHYQ